MATLLPSFALFKLKSAELLTKTLEDPLKDFGPRREAGRFPEIHPSNAFIGFFLRLDVLSRYGQTGLVLEQLRRSYVPMAQTTGTLWEHKNTQASCNHGFASHVAHILFRDILGVRVDPIERSVTWTVPNLDLAWCRGRIPVGDDWIEAGWERVDGGIRTCLSTPRTWGRTKITH